MESFDVIGEISDIEPIAVGRSIRELPRLRKQYGAGRWRKLKGVAMIRLRSGLVRRAELHWYEAHGIGRMEFNANAIWTKPMKSTKSIKARFAICVNNDEYPASLELHKVYRVLPDKDAELDGDLRVIDESGEDYLYPAELFVLMELPSKTARTLSASFSPTA